ncbi:hypothetical protein [Actinomyces sp. MRS3W]|uniref:hypothetical protein n=1 Tax=Actinomyces sp. MRS3W TaxID=2800796 RepID=UPI0028FD97F3|nr:hypothetical protein [Actinomyces sp. MRS3W]MDU0348162.1 hypothetical protein [Actinomyces sp. MRS3W]
MSRGFLRGQISPRPASARNRLIRGCGLAADTAGHYHRLGLLARVEGGQHLDVACALIGLAAYRRRDLGGI